MVTCLYGERYLFERAAMWVQAGVHRLIATIVGAKEAAESITQEWVCTAAASSPSRWKVNAQRLQECWAAGRPSTLSILAADR